MRPIDGVGAELRYVWNGELRVSQVFKDLARTRGRGDSEALASLSDSGAGSLHGRERREQLVHAQRAACEAIQLIR